MKRLTILVVLALMLGALVAGFAIFGGGSAQAGHPGPTIFVDDDACPSAGKGTEKRPFCSIQDAVNHATASVDTIQVSPGTYNENVVVGPAGLVLRGVGATQPVVDASFTGSTGIGIKIPEGINGVTIDNFLITGAGPCGFNPGIRVESNGNTIINNTLIDNTCSGILLTNVANDNDVSINDVSLSGSSGIQVQSNSERNTIHHNTTHDNTGDGINVGSGPDNMVYSNMSINNTKNGIRLEKISGQEPDGNDVMANDLGNNGKDGILLDAGADNNVIKFNNAFANAENGIDDQGTNKCTSNTAAANGVSDFTGGCS